MTLRPARRTLTALAVIVLCAVLALLWPPALWLSAPVALLVVAGGAADFRDLRRAGSGITVRRLAETRVARGLPVRVGVEASVPNAVRGMTATLCDVRPPGAVAHQPGDACDTWTWPATEILETGCRLVFPVRGRHAFGPLALGITGRWRILEGRWRRHDGLEVTVLPVAAVSPDTLVRSSLDEAMVMERRTRSRIAGIGTEFESLVEYREGDDPKRIDWRATARLGQLTVRRYQLEQHRDVLVVLDTGRLMGARAGNGTKLDCAVESALMLARSALQRGDRCGLCLFDSGLLGFLPPRAGAAVLRGLTDAVATLQSMERESDLFAAHAAIHARHSKRCLVVVLSDLVDEATTPRARAALAAMARRHVVLFVAIRTPALVGAAMAGPASTRDVARAAVAHRLLAEREAALRSIQRAGVRVLDLEPAAITVPLINAYWSIRSRNLL